MNAWKRMTAALLAASLISACDTAAPESTASQTAPEETAEASAQPETEPAAAVRGQGGTPWTDYDLKENISADITLSPKDDLYYSVNKDWLVQSEAGLFSWQNMSRRKIQTVPVFAAELNGLCRADFL